MKYKNGPVASNLRKRKSYQKENVKTISHKENSFQIGNSGVQWKIAECKKNQQ